MADEERNVTENADAEKKTARSFELKDVEATVGKMMTPNVKKMLEERYKVNVAAMIPTIHQNSPVYKGETIEDYSQRCIESALAMKIQKAFVHKIEENGEKKEKVEFDIKDTTEPKKEDEPDVEDEVHKKTSKSRKNVVQEMLGMPLDVVEAVVEQDRVAVILNRDKASVVMLTQEEADYLKKYIAKAKGELEQAREADGITLNEDQEKKEEPKTPEAQSAVTETDGKTTGDTQQVQDDNTKKTMQLSDGTVVTFKDYTDSLAKILEEPEMKTRLESLGISLEDIAGKAYGKIKPLEGESLDAYALRTIDTITTELVVQNEVENAQKVVNIHARPSHLKSREKDDEKLKENQDEDTFENIFKSIVDVVKFPFKFFKAVLTGKTDNEMKEEIEKTNAKEIAAILSPEIRGVLLNRIRGFETDSRNIAKKLGIIMVDDRGAKKTSQENEVQEQGEKKAPEPATPPTATGPADNRTTTAPAAPATENVAPNKTDGTLDPLPDDKREAAAGFADAVRDAGLGEPEGKKIVDAMAYERMTPEEKAAYDQEQARLAEEKKAREAAENEDHTIPETRGH